MITYEEALQLIDDTLRQIRETRDVGIVELRKQGVEATYAHAGMTIRELFLAMRRIERPPSIASYIFCEYILKLRSTAEFITIKEQEVEIFATTGLKLTSTAYTPDTLKHGGIHHIKLTSFSEIQIITVASLAIMAETQLNLKSTLDIPNLLQTVGLTLDSTISAETVETVMHAIDTLIQLESTLDIPNTLSGNVAKLECSASIAFSEMRTPPMALTKLTLTDTIDVNKGHNQMTSLGLTSTATIILEPI